MNEFLYILISLLISSVLLASIFYMAWSQFGRKKYALVWFWLYIAACFQWTINISNPFLFDDWTTYWLVVNVFPVCVISLSLYGHRLRVEKPTNLKLLISTSVAVYLLIVWFSVVQPHKGMQIAIIPFFASIVLAWIAYLLLTFRSKPSPPEKGAAIIYAIFSVLQLLSAFSALAQGVTQDDYYYNMYRLLNFIALPAGYLGTSMFTVFILADDMSQSMKSLAIRDPLTSIFNRRGFIDKAKEALALNQNQKYALIMGDLDHFKSINDRYGHVAGDQALCHFVKCVQASLSQWDIFGRVGGEEFLIMLLDTDAEGANNIAEEIRVRLQQEGLNFEDQVIDMTASFGVLEVNAPFPQFDDSFGKVDKALYAAKSAGRNTVKVG